MDIHKQVKRQKKVRIVRLRFSVREGAVLDRLQARLPKDGRLSRQQVLRAVVSGSLDAGLIQASDVQKRSDQGRSQKFRVHVDAADSTRAYEILHEIVQIGVSAKWAKRIGQEPCVIEDLTKAKASRLCRALRAEGIKAEIEMADCHRKEVRG